MATSNAAESASPIVDPTKLPFFRRVNRTDADRVLQVHREEYGVYLLRPSTQKGAIAISYINTSKQTWNALVHERGDGKYSLSPPGDNVHSVYPNIRDLLDTRVYLGRSIDQAELNPYKKRPNVKREGAVLTAHQQSYLKRQLLSMVVQDEVHRYMNDPAIIRDENQCMFLGFFYRIITSCPMFTSRPNSLKKLEEFFEILPDLMTASSKSSKRSSNKTNKKLRMVVVNIVDLFIRTPDEMYDDEAYMEWLSEVNSDAKERLHVIGSTTSKGEKREELEKNLQAILIDVTRGDGLGNAPKNSVKERGAAETRPDLISFPDGTNPSKNSVKEPSMYHSSSNQRNPRDAVGALIKVYDGAKLDMLPLLHARLFDLLRRGLLELTSESMAEPKVRKKVRKQYDMLPRTAIDMVLKIGNPMKLVQAAISLLVARPLGARSLIQRIFENSINLEDDIQQVKTLREKSGYDAMCKKIHRITEAGLHEAIIKDHPQWSNDTIDEYEFLESCTTVTVRTELLTKIICSDDAKPYFQQSFVDTVDDEGWQILERVYRLEEIVFLKKQYVHLLGSERITSILKGLVPAFNEPICEMLMAGDLRKVIKDGFGFTHSVLRVAEDKKSNNAVKVRQYNNLIKVLRGKLFTFMQQVLTSKKNANVVDLLTWAVAWWQQLMSCEYDFDGIVRVLSKEKQEKLIVEIQSVIEYQTKVKARIENDSAVIGKQSKQFEKEKNRPKVSVIASLIPSFKSLVGSGLASYGQELDHVPTWKSISIDDELKSEFANLSVEADDSLVNQLAEGAPQDNDTTHQREWDADWYDVEL